MTKITAVTVRDIRFPTSRNLDAANILLNVLKVTGGVPVLIRSPG